jgi:hypothetical protein
MNNPYFESKNLILSSTLLPFKPQIQPLITTVIFVLNDHACTYVGQGVHYRLRRVTFNRTRVHCLADKV